MKFNVHNGGHVSVSFKTNGKPATDREIRDAAETLRSVIRGSGTLEQTQRAVNGLRQFLPDSVELAKRTQRTQDAVNSVLEEADRIAPDTGRLKPKAPAAPHTKSSHEFGHDGDVNLTGSSGTAKTGTVVDYLRNAGFDGVTIQSIGVGTPNVDRLSPYADAGRVVLDDPIKMSREYTEAMKRFLERSRGDTGFDAE